MKSFSHGWAHIVLSSCPCMAQKRNVTYEIYYLFALAASHLLVRTFLLENTVNSPFCNPLVSIRNLLLRAKQIPMCSIFNRNPKEYKEFSWHPFFTCGAERARLSNSVTICKASFPNQFKSPSFQVPSILFALLDYISQNEVVNFVHAECLSYQRHKRPTRF